VTAVCMDGCIIKATMRGSAARRLGMACVMYSSGFRLTDRPIVRVHK